MNPSRILVALLILAGLAAGGYWLFVKSDDAIPVPMQPAQPEQPPAVVDNQPPPKVTGSNPTVDPGQGQPERVAAAPNNTNDDASQGVKGRVLLPGGAPAADVSIYLIESIMNDPIKVFLMTKSGKTPPPVSSGTTAADGTFALGVRQSSKSYDLRIVSNEAPEVSHQSIKVRDQDWFDTGDIQLETGVIVNGRVVDEISKVGIPNATVYLTGSNQAHTVLPTPGRERGIAAHTDQTGAFRFANAPTDGMINLTAEAPEYASARLTNLRVQDANNAVLEIAQGQPIAGVVVTSVGEPLSGVRVTATGMSQKTPQMETVTTDRSGAFHFPSLRQGPYTLATASNVYAELKAPPAMTGDLEVKLVMVERPWVKLAVTSSRGQPLKAYRISLKRHFPNNAVGIGNVPEFRDRSITPADYAQFGDFAAIRGLPAGTFVFQIQDRDHAKSLSPPFEVKDGGEPAEVIAQLTMGGVIAGTVIDDQGNPLRGAVVSTDMNNAFQGGGGIFDLFRSMIPERHSKAQTRTDRQGKFRLTKLAFAEYMVRISHSDFCEGASMDIKLEQEGQVFDAGVVQLARGTIVEGFTTITGQAAGQVKVTLSVPQPKQGAAVAQGPEGGAQLPTPAQLFTASVVSDNDGRYRLLKRVPPGTYKVVASRSSGENNPFAVLLDMRETERIVTLAPGQDRIKIDFDLSAR